jgi:hypothetical protein
MTDGAPMDDLRHTDPALADALAERAPAPDLTRSIMGRLGYMQASPAAGRRRRRARHLRRGAAALVVLGLVAGGAALHHFGPSARRPAELTLPAALGQDVHLHQERFSRTIETIRSFAPRVPRVVPVSNPVSGPDRGFDESVERSAVGPIC